MKSYLRKDSPWWLLLLVGGTVGLAIPLMSRSFASTFVIAAADHQSLFHVAWSFGLVLGITAACFDEALGTREFLEQRPIHRERLVATRIAACGLVLAGWFVLAPLVAYLGFALVDPRDAFGPVRHLTDLWSTMAVAVSACGIGFVAGSLPLPWWGRLFTAAALGASIYSVLFWLAYDGPSWRGGAGADLGPFGLMHLAVGVLALAIGARASLQRRDADRPRSPAFRLAVVAPLLTLGAPMWCMLQMEAEGVVVRWLQHRVYPQPMVDSSGDHVLLTQRLPDSDQHVIVDEHHMLTGDALPAGATFQSAVGNGPWLMQEFLRLEAPRGRSAIFNELVLDTDGSLWRHSRDDRMRSLLPVPGVPRFGPGASLGRVRVADGPPPPPGRDRARQGAVWDPETTALWLVDLDTAAVARGTLRDGDIFSRFGNMPSLLPLVEEGAQPVDDPNALFVVGERYAYVWRDGALQAVGRCAPEPAHHATKCRSSGDVLEWTLVVKGSDGIDIFSHFFTPKTAAEQSWAAAAMSLSLLRPPLAQLGAWVAAPSALQWQWLADPLVAGGRRAWLVGVCVLVAIVAAWLVRRRLRALGAPAATIRFWVAATLVLGVGAAICSVLFERPRAYARRVVPSVPAPKIFTPNTDEVPA